jgi:peptidyl-prolyl cis-trans isomerase C
MLLFLSACSTEKVPETDIVAQVNEVYITNTFLDEASSQQTSEEVRAALKRKIMEKWIEDEILYQSAVKEGLTLSKYEEQQISAYRKRILIEKYLEKHLNRSYRVLDQEVEDYYSQHAQEYVWNEDYVHLIHLVLDNDDRVIRSEIGNTKDLMEVIKKNFFDQKSTSERPIGDIGYVPLNNLPEKLAGRIKNMRTGTIQGPIKTEYGYHYVQLMDYQKKGATKPLDIVKEEIIERIRLQKRKTELNDLMRDLRTEFTIQTDLSKLVQP